MNVPALIREVTLDVAQMSADVCCGENAPDLSTVTKENWLFVRNEFLKNVSYNGGRSHNNIITVLAYLGKFQ